MNQEVFKIFFIEWVKPLQSSILGDVVAIDGKALCNSIDELNNVPAIHMVSAFSTATRLVLAQQKVDDKSNEITAIPLLLNMLNLKGTTVTIDAMGCQKAIAEKIIEKEADYVLALKGNQGSLNDSVRLYLEAEAAKKTGSVIEDIYEDVDKGHGRLETRKCIVTSAVDWLDQKPEWPGLKTIAMIEETREIKGKTSIERRFFISSLPANAEQIASTVRAHWLIENALHWTLDVVFNEDYSRVRNKNAGQNMAIVRHITYNMLENGKKHYKNIGIKKLRKKAGWGNSALDLILRQNF